MDEERHIVLKHVTAAMCSTAEAGNIGACAFEKDKKKKSEEECHLAEFIKRPKTTEQNNGRLKVHCHWLNSVSGARHWHTRSTEPKTVDLVCVVDTDVEMLPVSPSNMIKSGAVRKVATHKHPMRISDESHDFIRDEIGRRKRLEYEPSRVFADNGPDTDSDDDEEENQKKSVCSKKQKNDKKMFCIDKKLVVG